MKFQQMINIVLCRFLKQLPVQLLISIGSALFLGRNVDIYYISLSYTLSACFIEILISILPIIVFSFILKALLNLNKSAPFLLLIVFLGITCSNLLALTTAYFFGLFTLPYLGIQPVSDFALSFSPSIKSLYSLNLPKLLSLIHI